VSGVYEHFLGGMSSPSVVVVRVCVCLARVCSNHLLSISIHTQRLAGASLLIFANKQDLPSALTKEQIAEVL
jgi:signal recognition particle receptor subunit beta